MTASLPNDCVFCGILIGVLLASFVYQDETVVGFMDLNPVTDGHLLVIPRRHVSSLEGVDEATGQRMFTVASTLAAALRRSSIRAEGINLFLADGVAAGQEVFHCHLHVIPRYASDGVIITGDFTIDQDREMLDAQAAEIVSQQA